MISTHEQAGAAVARIAALRNRTFTGAEERAAVGREIADLSDQLEEYRASCRRRGIPYPTWSARDVVRAARRARGDHEED